MFQSIFYDFQTDIFSHFSNKIDEKKKIKSVAKFNGRKLKSDADDQIVQQAKEEKNTHTHCLFTQ